MDNTLINRINELAEKSYSENRFVFTDFLDMSQLSAFYSLERDLEYVGTLYQVERKGARDVWLDLVRLIAWDMTKRFQ